MSGFMKTVRISTQPSCYFSKKIHRLFQRQCVTALPTHPPCFFLAQPPSLLGVGVAGQGCPAKKFLSLCDPPNSPGSDPGGHRLVSAGSQESGLCTPTLLDGSFPEFSSGYRLQAGKVLPEM